MKSIYMKWGRNLKHNSKVLQNTYTGIHTTHGHVSHTHMRTLLNISLKCSTVKDSHSSYTTPSAPDGNLITHITPAFWRIYDRPCGESQGRGNNLQIRWAAHKTDVSHGDHMFSTPQRQAEGNDQRRDSSASHQEGLLNYFSTPDYSTRS